MMLSTHTHTSRIVGLAVASCMVFTVPWGAAANDQVDSIADRVSEAAEIATTDSQDEPQAEVQVAISADPEEAVVLASSEDLAVQVGLPEEVNVEEGRVADDGTMVYLGIVNSPDITIEKLTDGARISAVIEDSSQVTSFTYETGDLVPELAEDGSVTLFRKEEAPDMGQVLVPVGTIDAPWAVDAAGSHVPTHFELVDGKVKQVVETSAATVYPVVADPTVRTYWWGISVDFTRGETQNIAIGGSVCAAVVGSAGVVSKVAGSFCSVYSLLALHALSQGKCISSRFVGFGVGVNFFPWIRSC